MPVAASGPGLQVRVCSAHWSEGRDCIVAPTEPNTELEGLIPSVPVAILQGGGPFPDQSFGTVLKHKFL